VKKKPLIDFREAPPKYLGALFDLLSPGLKFYQVFASVELILNAE